MFITLETGRYNPETEEYDENQLCLVTSGCGCCEERIPVCSARVLDEAIKQHETFIAELKETRTRLFPHEPRP